MYDRILVPTDGSQTSSRAAEHAIDLATQYDAALHVLYVVETKDFVPDHDVGTLRESLEAIGHRVTDSVGERAEDAAVETVKKAIERGAPANEILEYVDDRDCDLLVMGTHGRSGLDRYLIGSVADKVVRNTPVPMLAVPGRGDAY